MSQDGYLHPKMEKKSKVRKFKKKRKRSKRRKPVDFWGLGITGGPWFVDTSYGLQPWIQWSPDLQIFGQYITTSSQQEWKSDNDRLDNEISIDMDTVGLGFRYRIGTSFYLATSINRLDFSGIYEISLEGSETVEHDYTARKIQGAFGLGNQWAADNGFTFGIDWIGYGIPISQSSSLELKDDGPSVVSDQDLKDALADQANYYAFLLHTGFTF